MKHGLRVAQVSTFVPTACGIATFTRDLALALEPGSGVSQNLFVAVEEDRISREYEFAPICAIWQNDEPSYQAAARVLNRSGGDIVHLQHEYGME